MANNVLIYSVIETPNTEQKLINLKVPAVILPTDKARIFGNEQQITGCY